MNHPHPVGVHSSEPLESVDPRFLKEGMLRARQNTIQALSEIRRELKPGLTEDDARRLCLEVFKRLGVTKHWHKPNVRFGVGTTLTFNNPLQPEYRFKEGDPFYLDLGPVWNDPELGLQYEGDYGDTFVLGSNPEAQKCADTARLLFEEARERWHSSKLSGQDIYRFLKQRSEELGYVLVEDVEGHRLGDFPHHKYSKTTLAKVPFIPSDSLWVLEIQINDPQKRFGAFFEDLL